MKKNKFTEKQVAFARHQADAATSLIDTESALKEPAPYASKVAQVGMQNPKSRLWMHH